MSRDEKPLVIITGAAGNIGGALIERFKKDYRIASLDIAEAKSADFHTTCDLSSQASVEQSLSEIKQKYGQHIAAVIHLAAYFDFTGKKSPLYEKINEKGTANLLEALADFKVDRFIYSSTMLVHEAGRPGQKISEDSPLAPDWAYPRSKKKTEEIIRKNQAKIPYAILRLAGIYDEKTAVPTLSHQIARIYERTLKSHVFSGDKGAGQAYVHKDDVVDAFLKVVDKRNSLPKKLILLVGEPQTKSYEALQRRIAFLLHGKERWLTFTLPPLLAKAGAWVELRAEPLIPDDLDQGKKPFIRPFMIDLASQHYELDISHTEELLDWQPKHTIADGLVDLIENLKKDPLAWYKANGITPADWMQVSRDKNSNPAALQEKYQTYYRQLHQRFLWAHFFTIALAVWLLSAPFSLGYRESAMAVSDQVSGLLLLVTGFVSLSWRYGIVRFVSALIGIWVLMSPLVFWSASAAAYTNATLVGALIVGFSALTKPTPGISPAAAMTGPTVPKGWPFSPSSWFQRMPIIILALVGFVISRVLAAYQLGHIDGVWEPFFAGNLGDPKNGTEEIITSRISEAWPVSDAGVGALTYMLEILTGVIGSARRWRTMPWLVMAFGFMIVPLGIVSITFIIIQPIIIGTWCTLCLIAAAAMLIQIPYSLDELVATGTFLWRRKKAGRPWIKIFFTGDTDEGPWKDEEDDFEQTPRQIVWEMLSGGVNLPWSLAVAIAIGIWLMFTRITLGAEGSMANADHLIGALVVTAAVTATAEVARPIRFLIIPLAGTLLMMPMIYEGNFVGGLNSFVCGVALIVLAFPKGPVRNQYGEWSKWIF